MARPHFVKRARKARPEHGIEVGDSYWWWKFRIGRASIMKISKTRPKRSQLTQSAFLGQLYDLEDGLAERLEAHLSDDGESFEADDVQGELESVADELENLGEEAEESFNNMPEPLQQGPTGELLEQRAEGLREWAEEVRSLQVDEDLDLSALADDVLGMNPGVE